MHPNAPARSSLHVTGDRRTHILDGDARGGGGHRHGTGRATKTEFPARWNDDRAIGYVLEVARRPDTVTYSPETSWGRPEQWMCTGHGDGVDVVAIVRADGGVHTAWPLPGGDGVVDNKARGQG